jgi:hypothetical protein
MCVCVAKGFNHCDQAKIQAFKEQAFNDQSKNTSLQ